MARLVMKDTVLNGCPLQAGDKVAIHFNMANRDPEKFPDEGEPWQTLKLYYNDQFQNGALAFR